MALITTGVSLDAGVWQQIGSSITTFVAQIQSVSPAAIYVGLAAPDSNSSYLTLDSSRTPTIVFDQLDGEGVWAKGLHGAATLTVVKG